jgi:acylphosphatase
MPEAVQLHLMVEGHVQGVGFRYFVFEKAQILGLTGWVRNRHDDQVEVTAEGDRETLEQLLAVIQIGPRGAFVSKVTPRWDQASGNFARFMILPTD